MSTILHIGNKRYSSWSLRAWMPLKRAGIAFEERIIPLDLPETAEQLAALSPVDTVPVLETGGVKIWDSLAIVEWAAERAPQLWPRDENLRALARSACASMHAGFMALRKEASMNLKRDMHPKAFSPAVAGDVARLEAIWRAVKRDGPFLFGDWSIADAFFTPVATRLRSYAIDVGPEAQAYVDALLGDPLYFEWREAGIAETYDNPQNDDV